MCVRVCVRVSQARACTQPSQRSATTAQCPSTPPPARVRLPYQNRRKPQPPSAAHIPCTRPQCVATRLARRKQETRPSASARAHSAHTRAQSSIMRMSGCAAQTVRKGASPLEYSVSYLEARAGGDRRKVDPLGVEHQLEHPGWVGQEEVAGDEHRQPTLRASRGVRPVGMATGGFHSRTRKFPAIDPRPTANSKQSNGGATRRSIQG